ncbi:hypothetical protein EG329_011206 [Mollisiaceae sp. DMI_Dod_QoI]|nr:hypothetical protein EG329_011206 [Helotiales sp. DMI_Dod_QoI]
MLKDTALKESSIAGFETTWQWVGECISGSDTSTVCGSISETAHVTPTCKGNAVLNTAYVTTTSTSSAHIYSPPSSINTALFSVETATYTTIITANAQETTFTSTFLSTTTHALSQTGTGSAAATTQTSASASAGSASSAKVAGKKGVTLSVGVLVGIGIGLVSAIAIGLGIFFCLRKKRGFKKSEAIKLDSTNYPPPNGPVGADQTHPYEAPVNEITAPPRKYAYTSPKLDTYEIDDRTAVLREKRSNGAMEMHADEYGGLRSPAPAYHEAIMPVELDGTSSIRAVSRG